MDTLAQQLVRNYYFFEAMAFYEAYYSPVSEHITDSAPKKVKHAVHLPGREEDHPLTWVPIVFHCTSFNSFERIVGDGFVKSPVSLTEIPIGELDRMKFRTSEPDQIAIGFPRRYVQTRNAASVLHTRHNPVLTELLNSRRDVREALEPFLAIDDDVSAFQELRATDPLAISEAVWLLTTGRDSNQLIVPARDELNRRWGKIATSFWHRSHQMEVLGEWQYLREERAGLTLRGIEVLGEHYWKKISFIEEERVIRMPAGRDWSLRFRMRTPASDGYDGPYTFFDLARKMKSLLQEYLKQPPILPYAIIADI